MKWTILSGTNRPQSKTLSFSLYLSDRLKAELEKSDTVTILDLQDLPPGLFKPEAYAQKPSEFEPFSRTILESDGILSVIPEYNGGAPGIFKYFIDMLPFPESLQGIPCAFFGLSAGKFGALRPIEQMQQIFGYRNAFIFPERLFVPGVAEGLNQNGQPTDPFVQKLLDGMLPRFVQFARKLRKA